MLLAFARRVRFLVAFAFALSSQYDGGGVEDIRGFLEQLEEAQDSAQILLDELTDKLEQNKDTLEVTLEESDRTEAALKQARRAMIDSKPGTPERRRAETEKIDAKYEKDMASEKLSHLEGVHVDVGYFAEKVEQIASNLQTMHEKLSGLTKMEKLREKKERQQRRRTTIKSPLAAPGGAVARGRVVQVDRMDTTWKASGNSQEDLLTALSEAEQHKKDEKLRIRRKHDVECRRLRELRAQARKKIQVEFENEKRTLLQLQEEIQASDWSAYQEFEAEIKESEGGLER